MWEEYYAAIEMYKKDGTPFYCEEDDVLHRRRLIAVDKTTHDKIYHEWIAESETDENPRGYCVTDRREYDPDDVFVTALTELAKSMGNYRLVDSNGVIYTLLENGVIETINPNKEDKQ